MTYGRCGADLSTYTSHLRIKILHVSHCDGGIDIIYTGVLKAALDRFLVLIGIDHGLL